MDLQTELTTLLVVSTVAVCAPFVVRLLRRMNLPQVVVLIVGGIVIGPEGLGWADPPSIELLASVGLGFLFLMAGYELEPYLFRERGGRLAVVAWFVSAAIAVSVTGLLVSMSGFVNAFVPVALGLTTTAFGTLLPILRANDMLSGDFGRFILPAGAVGELLPIVGIAIFLAENGEFIGLMSLVVMAVVALLLAWLPQIALTKRLVQITLEGEHNTSQITLRITLCLMFLLLVVASQFGLDAVLGAFLAGAVLRHWEPGDVHLLEAKLDAMGYGFFIPLFFVYSGMTLNLDSIAESPQRLVLFLFLLLTVRGVPALFLYRHDLGMNQRLQMTLLTATALPLLVALAQIGVSTGHMLPENAAALVGAGVLSVVFFPGLAVSLHKRDRRSAETSPREDVEHGHGPGDGGHVVRRS